MKQTLLICLSLILLLGCAEPIDFQIEGTDLIVVDGRISTELGESYIDIYTPRSNTVSKQGLNEYDVSIVTGTGEKITFESSQFTGRYLPDSSFKGEIGQKYRMLAISPEGTEIVSSYDSLINPAPFELEILDITEEQLMGEVLTTKNVKAVLANISTRNKSSFQAKFTFEYSYLPEFLLDSVSERVQEQFALFECSAPTSCENENGFLVAKETDRNWLFRIPNCATTLDNPCPADCCLKATVWPTTFIVKQESMSNQTFKFWKEIENLLTNDGLIFDTLPFPIGGNVSCESCDKPVVGHISIVGVSVEKTKVFL